VPTLIAAPAVIQAAGNKPKRIEEFVGRVNSQTAGVSIARMTSPSGWIEPGQRPEFTEYTIVLRGELAVESVGGGVLRVQAGQAVLVPAGEWVRYSTPVRRVPSTSRSACPRSRRRRCVATRHSRAPCRAHAG